MSDNPHQHRYEASQAFLASLQQLRSTFKAAEDNEPGDPTTDPAADEATAGDPSLEAAVEDIDDFFNHSDNAPP